MFFVRTSRTSLKLTDTSVNLPCRRKTTFLLCSPSWSAFGCCERESCCREEICWFRAERSCLMIEVSSLISTGLSSNSVFLFATCPSQYIILNQLKIALHCANFSNLPIVPDMPLPISAALLANSDLRGLPSPFPLPLAAAFCESVRRDCLCAPTFDDACRRCTWVKTDLNSVVLS